MQNRNLFIIKICILVIYLFIYLFIFRSIYVNESTGEFHRQGSLIHHKNLCETLRVIASEGGLSLYKGPLANKLVHDIQSKGGIITEKDLADYK